jgi:RNA polymerase sigma-70 factor (ECF subfamily)
MAKGPESREKKVTRIQRGPLTPAQREEMKKEMLKLADPLRSFAFGLCRDSERANDLVQETLLKAWDHIETFRFGSYMRAWLFTILRNTYFSQLRREKTVRNPGDEQYTALVERLAVPGSQEGAADLKDFWDEFYRMSPKYQEALTLIGAGFPYDEAAKIMGVPVGTVKSTVNRARNRLREILGYGPEKEGVLTTDGFSWEPAVLAAAGFIPAEISETLGISQKLVERRVEEGRTKLSEFQARETPEFGLSVTELEGFASQMQPDSAEVVRLAFMERKSFSQAARELGLSAEEFNDRLRSVRAQLLELRGAR